MKRAWAARARGLHRLAAGVVGAQLLVWTFTGFAFTWFDFAKVAGTADHAPLPSLRDDQLPAGVAAAVDQSRRRGEPYAAVRKLTLHPLLGRAVYALDFEGGRTLLVDAATGQPRPPVDAPEATRIALASFSGPPSVESTGLVTEGRDAPDVTLPAFRVRLGDPARTEVFVAPSSGEIVGWHNRQWRAFDWLWSLHVLGYVSRAHPDHLPLRIVAGLALIVALSGALLFGGWLVERLAGRIRRTRR